MPVIKTDEWQLDTPILAKIVPCPQGIRLPVFAREFKAPHDDHLLVYPSSYLSPDLWKLWMLACQRYASFDVENKRWIWSKVVLDRVASDNDTVTSIPASALTKEERAKLRAERTAAEEKFNEELTELSKAENVPEDLWNTYSYPCHYTPAAGQPAPTALQRIVIARYWNQPYALIAASVGTGKTRMVVDILSSRASAPGIGLRNGARIILIVAPLALHENWRREFLKWSSPGTTFDCHIFAPTDEFWERAERCATKMFDGPKGCLQGGQVIIVTPNALSRDKFTEQLAEKGWTPTAVIVDEVQRFFRKPQNKAYKRLTAIREKAHIFLGLSGTPTSKFEDWWALEELMAGTEARKVHWRGASYLDYQKLGDKELMANSGLWQKGWSYERSIKEYHAQRIKAGHIFCADKFYYMRDALPGIGQEELGQYSDLRLSFSTLFEEYPKHVEDAVKLQLACSGGEKFKGTEQMFATVLMLRMRQLMAISPENDALLKEFVEEFLDENESAVFWVEFVNEPAPQLDRVVDILNTYAPTCYIKGGMDPALRQEAIDGFQAGRYRFLVGQNEAAGVGLTLTRACKNFFLTVPLGYQTVTQNIGRLHRLGQTNDVMSFFSMTHPIACFARYIYDNRKELNEVIPSKISGVLPKEYIVDAEPALH